MTAPQRRHFAIKNRSAHVRDFRFIPRIIRKIFRALKHSFRAFGNDIAAGTT
jgi:hypothetical protein